MLHSFTGGADGATPFGGLTRDSAGNLYGTTETGGAFGYGVVFKLDTTGKETVLYNFTGGTDGGFAFGDLIRDSSGNLYSVSYYYASAAGVVFKLDMNGKQTLLYSFTGGADGGGPAGLIRDPAGNLYGTLNFGGASGYGGVFKLDTSGVYKLLYSFTGGLGGNNTFAGLVGDAAGNLHGTTSLGGIGNAGVVFKLQP